MKKGFTLVEILATIILLAVISAIAVPIIGTVIDDSKQSALNQTISSVEKAAANYSVNNNLGYSSKTKIIEISALKETGFLKNEPIINPVTNEELEGCILYRWDDDNKQYQFNYDEDCEVKDLEVNITTSDDNFNELDWANEDFYVQIETTGSSYSYCVDTKKCSPKANVGSQNGNALVSIESDSIYVCAYAIDGNNTSETVCSLPYKLDKTNPTAGTIDIVGTKGNNDWYISDVTIEAKEGNDLFSGHLETTVNINKITENTEGKTVTVTTKDKAGNIATRNYVIKVDKTIPQVEIIKASSTTRLTAIVNPVDTSSTYSYKWYKDGAIVSGATTKIYIPEEAGTYKLEAMTGAGLSKISNEITINSYTISYNLNGGTGSIDSTTKVEDINTNITSEVPTRSGYTFIGWGSSTSDTTVDYLSNTSYIANENKTLYAIWKKTITITFVGNGATVSAASATCDMYNDDTSCKVIFPTITRADFTITGFNTNKDATTSQVNSGTEKSVSSNETYYAITSREITVTYAGNGATSGTVESQKCTIRNSATSCSITTKANGFTKTNYTFQGWGTSTSVASYNAATQYQFSNNTTLKAIWKANYICTTGTLKEDSIKGSSSGGYICTTGYSSAYNSCKHSSCGSTSYTYSCTDYYDCYDYSTSVTSSVTSTPKVTSSISTSTKVSSSVSTSTKVTSSVTSTPKVTSSISSTPKVTSSVSSSVATTTRVTTNVSRHTSISTRISSVNCTTSQPDCSHCDSLGASATPCYRQCYDMNTTTSCTTKFIVTTSYPQTTKYSTSLSHSTSYSTKYSTSYTYSTSYSTTYKYSTTYSTSYPKTTTYSTSYPKTTTYSTSYPKTTTYSTSITSSLTTCSRPDTCTGSTYKSCPHSSCGSYNYCPSGWSDYNGQGCYKNATLGN